MALLQPHVPRFASRRDFLLRAGGGFGTLALASLLRADGLLPESRRQPSLAFANGLSEGCGRCPPRA